MYERITDSDIAKRSMERVSTTPNRKTAFGESNLDAEKLKARFDLLAKYVAIRLNEVFDGLPNGDLAEHLYIAIDGAPPVELAAYIQNMRKGDLEGIMAKTPSGEATLGNVCDFVFQVRNGLGTGDLAREIVVASGVSLKQFYDAYAAKDYIERDELDTLVQSVINALPRYNGEVEDV